MFDSKGLRLVELIGVMFGSYRVTPSKPPQFRWKPKQKHESDLLFTIYINENTNHFNETVATFFDAVHPSRVQFNGFGD